MSIFKRNLTSKILEDQSSLVISNKISPIAILEVGCGNGNISLNLAKNFPSNKYYASDISAEAISQAKSISHDSVEFKVGSGIDLWLNQKFDLVVCDMSAISEKIANLSDWYDGVSCLTGDDGLDVVKPIIKNVKHILSPGGVFIMPIISLCNVPLQKEALNSSFSLIDYSEKIKWPLPKDLLLNMENDSISFDSSYLYVEKKFGMFIASTYAAICSL